MAKGKGKKRAIVPVKGGRWALRDASGAPVPSRDLQVAAAQTRVAVDSKNGVETPPWIRELAQLEKV